MPSISLCVCIRVCIPPIVAGQRLGSTVPAVTNTLNNRRIVGRVCLWVCLCIPLSLLGNNSVKTSPWQRRIVGGVVFYAVCAVSKESRRLVLPRTSCFLKIIVVQICFQIAHNLKLIFSKIESCMHLLPTVLHAMSMSFSFI
jgi:hypothetical protein